MSRIAANLGESASVAMGFAVLFGLCEWPGWRISGQAWSLLKRFERWWESWSSMERRALYWEVLLR